MKVTAPIRYSLLVLLVLFQSGLGVSVWAGETPASMVDVPEATCLDHGGDHCDMLESAGQSRTACGGSACAAPSMLQAVPLLAGANPWLALQHERFHEPLPRSGYRNPLERPPSL
ncbi:hypothetical protein [Saccharospirillum salsuginis]|nr:hypothetical protein [Saccharospirillum salsuginis]